ncbi:hypothetical protein JG688_00014994, partial [Phytophthora aleatoria]
AYYIESNHGRRFLLVSGRLCPPDRPFSWTEAYFDEVKGATKLAIAESIIRRYHMRQLSFLNYPKYQFVSTIPVICQSDPWLQRY